MRRNCLFYVQGNFAIQEDMFRTLLGQTTNCARIKWYKPPLTEWVYNGNASLPKQHVKMPLKGRRQTTAHAKPLSRHFPKSTLFHTQHKLIYGRCHLLPHFTDEESEVQRSVAWASDQLGNSPDAMWLQVWPSPLHTPVRDRGPHLTPMSDSWLSNKDSDTC